MIIDSSERFINNCLKIESSDFLFKQKIHSIIKEIAETALGSLFLTHFKDQPIYINESNSSSTFKDKNCIKVNLDFKTQNRVLFKNECSEWKLGISSPQRLLIHELLHALHYIKYTPDEMANRGMVGLNFWWSNAEERSVIEGDYPKTLFREEFTENNLCQAMGEKNERLCYFLWDLQLENKAGDIPILYSYLVYGANEGFEKLDFKKLNANLVANAYLKFPISDYSNLMNVENNHYIKLISQHKVKVLSILLQKVNPKKKEEIIKCIAESAAILKTKGYGNQLIQREIQKLVQISQYLLHANRIHKRKKMDSSAELPISKKIKF